MPLSDLPASVDLPTDAPTPGDVASAAPASSKFGLRFEIFVVLGILLALLMGALDQFVVLTALPKILEEFGQPNSGTFVVTAFIITSTLGIPIFGKLSDLWSRRNVFLGGLAIFVVGSMLAGLSQTLPELIAFRAVQGFGSGGFFPVGIAIVAVSFPPKTRARITGALSGVFGIATVAGPLFGAWIVGATTWRWVFYVNLPIGIVGGALIIATLGPLRPAIVRRFDLVGAGLLAGWVGALEFALIQVTDSGWSWTDPRVLGLLGTSAIVAAVFVYWEVYRAREPLLPLRLLRDRVVGVSGATTFLVGCVFFPLATFISLVVGFALTPPGASAADTVRDVLYALIIPLVFGAAIGGQLLPVVSYRTQVVLGLVIAAVGLFGLRMISATTPTWVFYGLLPVGGVILPLIPLGFGVGLTFPVFLLAVQNEVQSKDVGEASGLVQFLQSLGGSVGLSVLASYAAARYSALSPAPMPACYAPNPSPAVCSPYFGALAEAQVSAYDSVFTTMLVIVGAAILIALLFRGRLIRGAPPHATEPLDAADGGTGVGRPAP